MAVELVNQVAEMIESAALPLIPHRAAQHQLQAVLRKRIVPDLIVRLTREIKEHADAKETDPRAGRHVA